MLTTLKCRYARGVFRADRALPRGFNPRNILVVLEIPESRPTSTEKVGARFCGVWQDPRQARTIWREIKSHR